MYFQISRVWKRSATHITGEFRHFVLVDVHWYTTQSSLKLNICVITDLKFDLTQIWPNKRLVWFLTWVFKLQWCEKLFPHSLHENNADCLFHHKEWQWYFAFKFSKVVHLALLLVLIALLTPNFSSKISFGFNNPCPPSFKSSISFW